MITRSATATLDKPAIHIEEDLQGRIVLVRDASEQHDRVDQQDTVDQRDSGEQHNTVERQIVEPVRAFPISDPEHFISLCDAHGRELVCIDDPSTLEPEARALLERELSRREFVPVIHRIIDVSSETEPSHWTVETNRGTTQFELRSDEDVRRLGPHGVLVVDKSGIRYMIPNTRKLDSASRKRLMTFF